MKRYRYFGASAVCSLLVLAGLGSPWNARAADNEEPRDAAQAAPPLSLAEAKQQARVMHTVYAATLESMHHHYFHANKAVLPARALEDVFAAVAEDTQSKANWISVNTRAMSVDHEPSTDFEKRAAAEIAAGKSEYAAVEDGYYRRAGAIPLTAGCVSCHAGLGSSSKKPRFAGLVISLPVRAE